MGKKKDGLHICMVSSEFPPKWGGVGNGVHFQSNVFAKWGYKIDIITRKMKGVTRPKQHKNITIHEVDWLYAPMFFTTSFGRNSVKKIVELGNPYDVVHVHSNMALLYKKHYNQITSPIVSTMHGTWVGERSMLRLQDISFNDIKSINDLAIKYVSPIFDKYEDYALSYSNAATCDSIQEHNANLARPGVKNIYGKDRIVRIPEGVDVDQFHPRNFQDGFFESYGAKKNDNTVVSVARLAGRKRVDLMINAWKYVAKKNKHAKLMVVGEGPQEAKLKAMARDLHLEKSVLFTDKLPFKELMAAYASADIFSWHSVWEGQGLVISESLASGTPCVSPRVGGAPEMISHGNDGYVHEVFDLKNQAKYILKLLADDDMRAEFSKTGRKRMVKDWSWQVIVERYDKLYRKVMKDEKKVV